MLQFLKGNSCLLAFDSHPAFQTGEKLGLFFADFVQDFEQDAEGFVIVNHAQGEFKGKFWRAAPEKTPPVREGMKDGAGDA